MDSLFVAGVIFVGVAAISCFAAAGIVFQKKNRLENKISSIINRMQNASSSTN